MSAIDVPSQVTAAILCGGLGTRLRSEVADRPKFLAEVGGKPFAHYVLAGLAHVGVRQAVLCTGFMGDLVERTLGPAHAGIALSYSREDTPLGTGGALRAAEGLLRSPLVLALNGDSFCDADLGAMFAFHAARASFATMLLVRVEDPRRFGRVILDAEQRVVRFEEKSDDPSPAWVNAGVYLLARERLAEIPAGRAVSFERETLTRWAGAGLQGYASEGTLVDIGTPESLRAAGAVMARIAR